MDMERSKLVELDHPWYQGVTLYILSRGAEHNSESYQRYLDGLVWRSSFESLTRRRSGALQKALECYVRRRRRQCLGVVSNQTPYLL